VKPILGPNAPANAELPLLFDKDPWPKLTSEQGPVSSNMRISSPRAGPDDATNFGHAEQKMLTEFDTMAEGVFGRDGGGELKECPKFIILATKLFPCYKNENVGCGQTYIKTTKNVLNQCTTEATRDSFLYLYVRDNPGQDWHKQRQNFEQNGIKIIFPSK
jgi:hypothetical protein